MLATNLTGLVNASQPFLLSNEPFVKTNDNVKLNEEGNGLLIVVPGLYKVRIQTNLYTIIPSGQSIGNAGASLYINGQKVDDTEVVFAFTENSRTETIIEYPIEVKRSDDAEEQVLVQFYSVADATLESGYVTVERIS